jgi:predicted enzyme related to lactoylglutathione lyase
VIEMQPNVTGCVVHLELHTGDQRAAAAFYQQLLSWRTERVWSRAGSYLTLDVGPPISGGIVECGTARPLWLPYVAVDDIHRSTDAAQSLGATVTLAPREGPAGWRSVVSVPNGGELALWQAKGPR